MGILGQFGIENYAWKNLCNFLYQTILIPPDQNVLIPSDQNVSILLGSNMYNGNIGTSWPGKLCMKG